MTHLLRTWLWPIVIFISVIGVIFCTFINPGTPAQGIVLLWFVTFCPGMSIVPLMKLNHFVIEVTLAVALGLSIDAIIVAIFLYSKYWSPPTMLWVLIVLSLIGSTVQLGASFINRPT